MATTAAPFGARPSGSLSTTGSYTGKRRAYKIASAYDTNIFEGDFVKAVAAGTIEKDAGTATLTPLGVFLGCSYTDPVLNYKLESNYWPANTVATDAVAFVNDDPDLLMMMQADGQLDQTDLFLNAAIIQTAGSTSVGRSKNAVDSGTSTAPATTNTLPLRIVEFVDGPDSAVGDSFTDVIVKFNAGHLMTNTTGT